MRDFFSSGSGAHVCPCVCWLIQKRSYICWISFGPAALLARQGLISREAQDSTVLAEFDVCEAERFCLVTLWRPISSVLPLQQWANKYTEEGEINGDLLDHRHARQQSGCVCVCFCVCWTWMCSQLLPKSNVHYVSAHCCLVYGMCVCFFFFSLAWSLSRLITLEWTPFHSIQVPCNLRSVHHSSLGGFRPLWSPVPTSLDSLLSTAISSNAEDKTRLFGKDSWRIEFFNWCSISVELILPSKEMRQWNCSCVHFSGVLVTGHKHISRLSQVIDPCTCLLFSNGKKVSTFYLNSLKYFWKNCTSWLERRKQIIRHAPTWPFNRTCLVEKIYYY